MDFGRGVHRIIGTIIGGIIAVLIIEGIENKALLTLLLLLFSGIYVYVAGTKNYAFRMIFITVMVLESIIIGALLSFLTLFVIWIIPKTRSNYASRKVG